MVDLPDPFSPTRKVTPGGRSSPSATSWPTAGTVIGQAWRAGTSPGSTHARTTGGWSDLMAANLRLG